MEKTENIRDLEKILRELRVVAIVMNKLANSGHIGGSLSWLHILVALLFSKMKYDPANPKWPERDRLILSKGHGCLALYAALAKLGYFSIDELWKLRRELGALLQGHPYSKIPGIEVTTGSLGQGLSYACTIALSQRLKMVEPLPWIYVILGDGEMQEGQVWEAAMFAAHNKIGNLIAILDCNGWQIDGKTEEIMNLNPVAEK
jgi:transketolase